MSISSDQTELWGRTSTCHFSTFSLSGLTQFVNLSQKHDALTKMTQKVTMTPKGIRLQDFSSVWMWCTSWVSRQVFNTGWLELLSPSLDQIFDVCTAMENWLQGCPKHALVLHCKVNMGCPLTVTLKCVWGDLCGTWVGILFIPVPVNILNREIEDGLEFLWHPTSTSATCLPGNKFKNGYFSIW